MCAINSKKKKKTLHIKLINLAAGAGVTNSNSFFIGIVTSTPSDSEHVILLLCLLPRGDYG